MAAPAESVDAHTVFRAYTRVPRDRACLILDVRHHKEFKRRHLLLSYCVRLTSDGKTLLDYSHNAYDVKWAQGIWWSADVLVVGEPGLRRSHPVIAFLETEARAASIGYLRGGVDAFEAAFPVLVGQSLKAHRGLSYPTPIVDGALYLGSWQHAADTERLAHLGIRRVVTLHNEPSRLKPPPGVRHMAITITDLPTSDISAYFDVTYRFLEDGLAADRPALVHCGAGTSRSAAICAAYLMRKRHVNASAAVALLVSRRSSVCPNEGFWRQLCASEAVLGIPPSQRSNPERPVVVNESYGALRAAAAPQDAVAGEAAEVLLRPVVGGSVGPRPEGKRVREGIEADAVAKRRLRDGGPVVKVAVSIFKGGEAVGLLELPSLKAHQRCTFGRAAEATVQLQHASISRIHAELTVTPEGRVFLRDLGSAHGTNVNGLWIKANDAKVVTVGMKFRFGASSRVYAVDDLTIVTA